METKSQEDNKKVSSKFRPRGTEPKEPEAPPKAEPHSALVPVLWVVVPIVLLIAYAACSG
ncbi:MAG: hypothetical protein U0271_10585 [Polyangiaceae bacterium]